MPPKHKESKDTSKKQSRKSAFDTITPVQSTFEIDNKEPPPVKGPYDSLIYVPQPPKPPPFPPTRKTARVPVLKRKPLPEISNSAQGAPPAAVPDHSSEKLGQHDSAITVNTVMSDKSRKKSTMQSYSMTLSQIAITANTKKKHRSGPLQLDKQVIAPKPLGIWKSPNQTIKAPPDLVFPREKPPSFFYTQKLESNYQVERNHIERHTKVKLFQLKMEDHIMSKTGKSRERLLLRRKQVLPKMDPAGEEKDSIPVERTETPEGYTGTSMFVEMERVAKCRNGLCVTLTRREKGYNVVRDWLGCPVVTDEMCQKLNVIANRMDVLNPMNNNFTWDGDDFQPSFPTLGVVGICYNEVHKYLDQLRFEYEEQNLESVYESSKNTDDSKKKKMTTITRSLGADISAIEIESRASLTLGRAELEWTTDPERAKKKWIVELGCTADIGKDTVNSVTMTNTGTTAIQYNWVKVHHSDMFTLKKYELQRFVFDNWGGVILPNETFRVPFLYKCTEPGFYSEDWRMLTKPVLENGAHIILRLWGITRQYDPFRRIRSKIEEDLRGRMIQNIVTDRVDKIVSYLPLKEVPLNDTRFPLFHLGPDLFHINNPWLYYHCASVFRLGKLQEILESRQVPRQTQAYQYSFDVLSGSGESDKDIDSQGSQNSLIQEMTKEYMNTIEMEGTDGGDEGTPVFGQDEDDALANFHPTGNLAADIKFVQDILKGRITPSLHILTLVNQSPTQFDGEGEEPYEPVIKHPRAPINLTNPDVSVDDMRNAILCADEIEEIQEAMFLTMNDQVSRLLFRTDQPAVNWKQIMVRTLLCAVIDSFDAYAASLQEKCCVAEMIDRAKEREQALMVISEKEESDTMSLTESQAQTITQTQPTQPTQPKTSRVAEISPAILPVPDSKITNRRQTNATEVSDIEDTSIGHSDPSSRESQDSMMECMCTYPQDFMRPQRYKVVYLGQLYCKMHDLLAEFFVSLERLIAEKTALHPNYERKVFTRVRDIPLNMKIEDLLKAPLPPKWVKMAERINSTETAIRAHKEAVEDSIRNGILEEMQKAGGRRKTSAAVL